MSTLDELIAIYERQPLASVPNDPKYIALCNAHVNSPRFNDERRRVEEMRALLEETLNIQKTGQSEVRNALEIFVYQHAPDNNQEDEIVRRLVRGSWYPRWTKEQKAYFDASVTKLREGNDYFLSFTQRNKGGAGNPVNRFHRYLIQSYGLADPIQTQTNELATAIDRELRNSRYKFRGFFFPMHEDDSQEVIKKLQTAIDGALVFIQIVQNDMFSKDYKQAENYCYDEYVMASGKAKQTLCIFADGQHPQGMILKLNTYPRFSGWYDFVRKIDCVSLARTREFNVDSANIASNQDALEKLMEQLWKHRESLWCNPPKDLPAAGN